MIKFNKNKFIHRILFVLVLILSLSFFNLSMPFDYYNCDYVFKYYDDNNTIIWMPVEYIEIMGLTDKNQKSNSRWNTLKYGEYEWVAGKGFESDTSTFKTLRAILK